MKATLKLNNPLWKTPGRKAILDKAVQASAVELEKEIKQTILNSTPRGRTYRRGAIRKKIAKRDLEFYRSNKKVFKRKFTGLYKEKTTVGYSFHRASAPGQAPAVDTGGLLNSIRAHRLAVLKARVSTSKKYAAALDNGATINNRSSRTRIAGPFQNRTIAQRPFFASTAEKFKSKFKENIRKAIAENS